MTDPYSESGVRWLCPNCRGGFPDGPLDEGCCPWCGQTIDGSYEPQPMVSVAKTAESEEDEASGGPIYRSLFGWLE